MKRLLLLLLLVLVAVPIVHAEDDDSCGILNLATCLPEKAMQYLIEIINAPLQPLLDLTKDLLSEPIEIDLFASLWATMIYIISLFYGILLLYSGFNFMISGHDVVKRENAKTWLRNILIMIVLVQASYFLYELSLEIGAGLSAGVINMIPNEFFLLTVDTLPNVGLELIFSLPYVFILLFTVLLLLIRYVIVAVGLVFFPLGIFFYFFEPLKPYGNLIINTVLANIFVTFIASVFLLAFSKLVEIGFLNNVKMLIMIAAFSTIDVLLFFVMFFVMIKAALKVGDKAIKVAFTAAKFL